MTPSSKNAITAFVRQCFYEAANTKPGGQVVERHPSAAPVTPQPAKDA